MSVRVQRAPGRAGPVWLAVCLSLAPLAVSSAWAAGATGVSAAKGVSKADGKVPARQDAKAVGAKPGAKAAAAVAPAYRIAPIPAWVVEPSAEATSPALVAPSPAPKPLPPGLPGGFGGLPGAAGASIAPTAGAAPAVPGAVASSPVKALRAQLLDTQIQLGGAVPVAFIRTRMQALDASMLRELSEPRIAFNPEYQKLVIHGVAVTRDGLRQDRTQGLRVEMMRREQRLESQMLDGLSTALVILNDVRVGDVVEVAYSIEGANPIFEGRFSELLQLAADIPVDRAFVRILTPAGRALQTRPIGVGATDIAVRREPQPGGGEILTVVRDQVPPVLAEAATPPWFKVYPALHVSEYRDWEQVDRWAQGLFTMAPPSGEIAERIAAWKARDLPPEALVAEVLRFVQDEVRYFSLSLGESSHRPKPAARTLAERQGDCKDKVLLLNTLLTGLGFEPRPALVSMARNRGVGAYLPSHDQFDHVITHVVVNGQAYYLDATMNGQGFGLRERGYFPYGQALIVGAGQGPQAVALPDFASDRIVYRQDWDLSDLTRVPALTTAMTLRGLSAERWRAYIASSGLDRVAESMGGVYVRQFPGLKPSAPPELADSRETNELTVRMHFESPMPGTMRGAVMQIGLPQLEFLELMTVPPEATRRMPFMLDTPRSAESRVSVQGPVPMEFQPPPQRQAGDNHFSVTVRTEVEGRTVSAVARYERRGDEVLPAEMDAFRQAVVRGRQAAGTSLVLPLVAKADLEEAVKGLDKRLARYGKGDALLRVVVMQEAMRVRNDLLLRSVPAGSVMARQALGERAQAQNLLEDPAAALKDADAALAIDPKDDLAIEARGVALLSLGRLDEAIPVFEQMDRSTTRGSPDPWLGIALYENGRHEEAEPVLRQVVDRSAGDGRAYALLWLALAQERREPGKGRALLAGEVRDADTSWPGALTRFLAGRIDRDALLKTARAEADVTRLRLAEAYFFIGQSLVVQGKRDEATPWFDRAVDTRAAPYREYILAKLELRRAAPAR
ncbi:hypothetical protein CDN99_03210 [Roseateles aquatilis]|uniref:DUF3857 domain-containing protein n=1 Tax=Roseateles aquatilis TaxID=431061 RepID=A0A246JLK4_9BURK|nr:DUF3857 domain-containing protein [Roseateles aquatilis]OWQ93492.1 hypothetical protein CDN99_03210 [Roseateles aquatilis]